VRLPKACHQIMLLVKRGAKSSIWLLCRVFQTLGPVDSTQDQLSLEYNTLGGGRSGFGPRLKPNSGPDLSSLPWRPKSGILGRKSFLVAVAARAGPIVGQFCQNLFHLRHNITLIVRATCTLPLGDDISGPPKSANHRIQCQLPSASKTTPAPFVANRWKHEHMGRSEMLEDFPVTEPAAKKTALSIPRISLAARGGSARTIADDGKIGQTARNREQPAQSKITSLPRNQAANENQLQFGPDSEVAASQPDTQRASNAGLRDKKQFAAICDKLRVCLG